MPFILNREYKFFIPEKNRLCCKFCLTVWNVPMSHKAEKRQTWLKYKPRSRGTQPRLPPKCIENTFSLTIQSTFKSLEMHSNRRYKSCICSVVLEQFESFRNHLGPIETWLCAHLKCKPTNFCVLSYLFNIKFNATTGARSRLWLRQQEIWVRD